MVAWLETFGVDFSAKPSRISCALRRLLVAAKLKRGYHVLGTVKFYSSGKGFGFITPDEGGADVFVHVSALDQAGMAALSSGDRVTYNCIADRQGRRAATDVRPA